MKIKEIPSKLKSTYLVDKSTLSVKEQVGYCAGLAGNTMGQDCVHTYGDVFATDFVGISPQRKLIKDNIGTVLSFIVPPIAGAWIDSPTKSKNSNMKKALMYMPIPFAIFSMLVFVNPSANDIFNFIFSFLCGELFNAVDAFYDIGMNTLGLKMVDNPNDRSKFYTLTSLATTLGSMLPGWILPIFLKAVGSDYQKSEKVYFFVPLVFCVFGLAAMLIPKFTVREKFLDSVNLLAEKKKQNEQASEAKVQWNRETVTAILRNRPFMVLQLSVFTDAIRQVTYKTLPYFYKYPMGDEGMKAIIDVISGAFSYVGIFITPMLTKRMQAHTVVAGGYAYTSAFYVILSLLDINFNAEKMNKMRYLPGILIGFAGMPNGAQGIARKIITADSTDYMEWYGYKYFGSPVKSDGILSAAANDVTKAAGLIKQNLYNGLLIAIGYQSNNSKSGKEVTQSPVTVRGIYRMVAFLGLIGNALSAVVFLFDNFKGERKETILAELAQYRKEREEATV